MKCNNCKYVNLAESSYCQKCGKQLSTTEEFSTDVINVPENRLNFKKNQLFGSRYRIIDQIGEGGMGKVFKAMDLELNIVVALKMIRQELMSEQENIIRFKRELLLTREIVHENVIRIHDLGEINGVKYISMNYIEGDSLDSLLSKKGKLDINETIAIFVQICQALKSAHEKNIVHRDLKPQNIMIDKENRAIILDFGIARSMSTDINTTATGITLGTPNYMSPEQIQGDKIDHRTDIYALGVMLYKVLTGNLPFVGKSVAEIYHKQMTEKPVNPNKIDPGIPESIEKAILKCLEINKEDRFQDLNEIIDILNGHNLESFSHKEPDLQVREPFLKKLNKNIIILSFFLFIIVISSTIFLITKNNNKKESIKKQNISTSKLSKAKLMSKKFRNIKNQSATFKIDLWLNKEKPHYMIGEEFRIYFKVDHDCYLTLLSLGTSGKTRILFPNRFQNNNRIFAGKIYSIPAKDASYIYQVQGPMGKEFVKAIATKNSINILDSLKPLVRPEKSVFTKLAEKESNVVKEILNSLKQIDSTLWAEAEKQITIGEIKDEKSKKK